MGEFDRVHHRLFLHFFRARLDHDNGIGGADDHDVEQAVAHFGVGGIGDEAAIDQADAHCAKRAEKRNIGKGQGGGSGVDAADIGIVFRVGGEDEGDDLGLALEAFGEHGTDRPVNLAASENFALAHAAFALDKTAGDASAGIGVLAIIDGERKEVDALAGFGIGGGGGEDDVFAEAHDGGAARLLGKFSGFNGELFSACDFDGNFCGFRLHRSSFIGAEGHVRGYGVRVDRLMPGLRLGTHFAEALAIWKPKSGKPVWNRPHTGPAALLFADAELGNHGFIPFRVVLLQVVEQATTPTHHHEKSAARAVVFLVRFEVFRQLTNALAQQRDLNFGTPGIGSVRAIRVNDGLFLLSG